MVFFCNVDVGTVADSRAWNPSPQSVELSLEPGTVASGEGKGGLCLLKPWLPSAAVKCARPWLGELTDTGLGWVNSQTSALAG